MAQGKTNAGIEQALHLSASTVEKHVNAIFAKLHSATSRCTAGSPRCSVSSTINN